jgi:aminobenzoyl-glutamate transport protein
MSEKTLKKSLVDRFLDGMERVCGKLPPPAILFCWLFLIVAVLGALFTWTGVSMLNQATKKEIVSQNLFTQNGLLWFLKNMVVNFTGFAPLGLVLTMTLAIGFCEESGMLITLIRSSLKNVPPAIVPYLIAFIGTNGNIASDTAMIVIPPLAALVYIGVKKNPIVGMLVGFAGAQAGFTANLMVAGTDSLLQGLTNTAIAAFIGNDSIKIDVTANWYFMIASTFLCALVIGYVSIKIVEPRFGEYKGTAEEDTTIKITPVEKGGLRASGIAAIIFIAILLVGFFKKILSTPDGKFVGSPLLTGIIPILFLFFTVIGITYGYKTGSFKSVKDVNKAMIKQMSGMGVYVVFCFFCGQFQGLFNWTNLGTMLAIKGANFLEGLNFKGIPMCILFILICAAVNLIISSGSAKWAIFAPIFVPMFWMLGYHPGFTQLLYRLGDSPFNTIAPTSPYIWMMLGIIQNKYDKNSNIGTLISGMLPIAVIMQIVWIIFLILWMLTRVDIGPGVGYYMSLPV